jgi:hypothetical protein
VAGAKALVQDRVAARAKALVQDRVPVKVKAGVREVGKVRARAEKNLANVVRAAEAAQVPKQEEAEVPEADDRAGELQTEI